MRTNGTRAADTASAASDESAAFKPPPARRPQTQAAPSAMWNVAHRDEHDERSLSACARPASSAHSDETSSSKTKCGGIEMRIASSARAALSSAGPTMSSSLAEPPSAIPASSSSHAADHAFRKECMAAAASVFVAKSGSKFTASRQPEMLRRVTIRLLAEAGAVAVPVVV
eukprot:615077-Pleurochrysis_carterae.AAC.2